MAPWSACFPYNLFFSSFSSVFALCGELSRRLDLNAQRALTLNVYNNNYQVFEHKPMVVSDDSDQVNMLVREREVGNVFRMFRNPDEYDASPAPTAIKVIDHDKQRWATLTLGEVLKHTGIWSGRSIDVTQDDDGRFLDHLSDGRNISINPLLRKRIIGDLGLDQLQESTIRAAVRSIDKLFISTGALGAMGARGMLNEEGENGLGRFLMSLCPNNIWARNPGRLDADYERSTGTDARVQEMIRLLNERNRGPAPPPGFESNIGTSAATASVGDVADALQRAMVDAVVPDPDDDVYTKAMSDAIMTSVNEVVSATENMTDSQRGSIASALVGAVANFKASKSSLKKIIRNTDGAKAADLDAAYGESIKKDFKSNWKAINSEAKKIASKIGIEISGAKEPRDKMLQFSTSAHCLRIESMGFDEIQRIIARWYLGCSIDLPTIVSLDNQGIVTPFGAYVFRPFQSFQMGSAVVM